MLRTENLLTSVLMFCSCSGFSFMVVFLSVMSRCKRSAYVMSFSMEFGVLTEITHVCFFCSVEWHSIIRATMPAFDPLRSPTRGMGAIAELCRTWPSSIRSNHPHLSFCALGKHAQYITDEHSLALGHGEQSPLARLYDCDAKILLLGVGHHNNSSMHLAELRAPDWTPIQQGASVLSEDGRSSCWVTFDDWAEESDLFPEIGALFEDHHKGQLDVVSIGTVGAATARLMSQRACVDFATEWFTNKRKHRTTAASS
eukprot:TRINITY_DN3877_c0_g1_i2.p1 TRINITY_DN3877_c0_g1~~TRINITY_DN3877_c0_g1_i2.p1  ORF type:complete len:256 (-),score=23.57 TRINITY_DN3877_c0_g1_i2:50-817(-)